MSINLNLDFDHLTKIFQQDKPVYIGQQMLVPAKLLHAKKTKEFLCIVTKSRFTILKDIEAVQQQSIESIKKLELAEAFTLAIKKGELDDVKFLLATGLVSDDLIKKGFFDVFIERDDEIGRSIGLHFYDLYKFSAIDQDLVIQIIKRIAARKLYSPNMWSLCKMLLEMEDFYSAEDNKKAANICFVAVKDKYTQGSFGRYAFSLASCLKIVFLMNLDLAQKIEIHSYIKKMLEALGHVCHAKVIGVSSPDDLAIDMQSANLLEEYISRGDYRSLANLVLDERKATFSQELLYCIFAQAKNYPANSDDILKYFCQLMQKNILIYDIRNAAEHGKFVRLAKLLKIAYMGNIPDSEIISILNIDSIALQYSNSPKEIVYILMIINFACEDEALKSSLFTYLNRIRRYNYDEYNEVVLQFEKEIVRHEFTAIDFTVYGALGK